MEIKLIYPKIPRTHSFFINSIFSYLFPTGPDLGNIEVKECTNENNEFKVKKKDKFVDFIVFYSHREDMFYYCDASFFDAKKESKVSSKKLIDYSILCTRNPYEIKERVEQDIIDIRILYPEILTPKMKIVNDRIGKLGLENNKFMINESINSIKTFVLPETFRKKSYNVFIEHEKDKYFICNSTAIEKYRKRISIERAEKISFFSSNSIDKLLEEMETLA